jgi:2-desacetyl-2-hydroxyethyl bacteriochlorophyllide A dehydrogenase
MGHLTTKAVLFTGVGTVAVGAVDVPEPGPGEVLIETICTAISPGTERRCLAGKQEGAPPFPVVPGYSLTGRVIARGAGVERALGALVSTAGTRRVDGAGRLWGGHIGHAVLPESEVLTIPVGVSPADAALGRLAAIAYHGVLRARPLPHERVAVVGLGPIGLLAARLYRAAGCAVIGVDPVPTRGARLTASGGVWAPDIDAALGLLPDGAQIVVDATGVPAVLADALRLAQELPWTDTPEAGPRVVIQGSYPESLPVPYDAVFRREATLLTPRNAQPRDQKAVLDLLARGVLRVDDLAEIRSPDAAPGVYAALGHPEGPLSTVFAWDIEPALA